MAQILLLIVYWICNILTIVLIVRSVLSWIVYSGNQYNPKLGRAYQFLGTMTEPIVAPIRRLVSRFVNTGSLDIAPLVAFFILIIIRRVLLGILSGM